MYFCLRTVFNRLKIYADLFSVRVEPRLETEFSAFVERHHPFKNQGADIAPKVVSGK